MRTSHILLGGLALLAAAGVQPALMQSAGAQGFLSAYEDLPLAPGLEEVPNSGIAFDSPGGRIVEAYAKGAAKAAEILKFYATTLPQLGWTRESDTRYRRDAELLTLEAGADGRLLVVHFTISPE
jgi:hypothetical protein